MRSGAVLLIFGLEALAMAGALATACTDATTSSATCGDCGDGAGDGHASDVPTTDAWVDAIANADGDAPGDARDATADDANAVDANAVDATTDARDDTAADAAARDASDASSTCPGTAPPSAVRIGGDCVDSTEVTNADYARFLAPDAGAIPAAPAACAFNTSHVPGAGTWPPPQGRDAYPVVAVDWCDAWSYCAWAGKRLCGRIGGGAAPFGDYADASASQWMRACSGGGAHVFPYGDAYDAAACIGRDSDAGGAPAPVGTPSCAGGFAGLFDMSGNVYEWEDSCDGTTGASDHCRARGGGCLTPGPPTSANLECASAGVAIARGDDVYVDIGFRCCSP